MVEGRLQRKPVAILFADVVGSSRLMSVDEAGTLSRLSTLMRDLIDPTIAVESGRIVKRMGDGVVVVFASAINAVTCAIEIQRQLEEYQADRSELDPIRFRIGVHVGDIIIEGNDILGDDVNVAVRVEGVAEPGGISISEDARRQVQGKVAASFVDAGEQSLKHLTRPVRVYRVAPAPKPVSRSETDEPRRRQVFVSYAPADNELASEIVGALRSAGHRILKGEWELAHGESIVERVERAIRSSDILLVLLSPNSVNSRWVRQEIGVALSQELQDRAITVIPALIQDCDIPQVLADRAFLDLRGDLHQALQRLVEQIGSASDLDFADLDYRAFENMAADLLRKLSFSVERAPMNEEFDFVATSHSRDASGAIQTEKWIVETKLYRIQRVGVAILQEMMALLSRRGMNGLIITNSRLTSVARSFLAENIKRSGPHLRVIDGTELTGLLIPHPDLIRTHLLSPRQR